MFLIIMTNLCEMDYQKGKKIVVDWMEADLRILPFHWKIEFFHD